jgi:alanyl-tRNA synthetase
MQTDAIRTKYLNFFKKKGHKILPSDSLVPENDPTLLFTSAGMNQFKAQFMGKNIDSPKVTTCQKCLRTGDLDEVGKTPYHHTFFEMLGNFSFGDYFKKEAISWAWEFMTDVLKIAPDKIWVSVYLDDDEAFEIWHKDIGLKKERIVRLGAKDNFWPSNAITNGPNGPCGPCSEIYVDRGLKKGCGKKDCKPGCSCRRFVEVWNLVFTQYKREGEIGKKGKLSPLPSKNIDTGMGLERIAQVMQDVDSNFEIDIFKPIVDFILKHSQAKVNKEVLNKVYTVADHMRAVVFSIGDGVIPSNEERGYVIRKLIRRSKHILSEIKASELSLNKIVPVITKVMRSTYSLIEKRRDNIAQIITEEEKKFEDIMQVLPAKKAEFNKKAVDSLSAGKLTFEYHDTYGIPREIGLEWAQAKLKNDFNKEHFEKAFTKSMKAQKDRSRKKSQIKSEIFTEGMEHQLEGLPKTKFRGYKTLTLETVVLELFKNGKKVSSLKNKEEGYIVLKESPFYAEGGGQVADKGVIKSKKGEALVLDVSAAYGYYLHKVKIISAEIKKKDKVNAEVDCQRRRSIAKNHTATHLLQSALRQVLGEHVEQSGSYVDDKRLRFDFTHFKQVDKGDLKKIENIVNGFIQDNKPVAVNNMLLKEAQKKNILAFFKEKYSDMVRVVSVGDISLELCGGTHIDASGSIGLFKITSESSIASGIRRIEAVTGTEALKLVENQENTLERLRELLKTDTKNLILALEDLQKEYKALKTELENYKVNKSKNLVNDLIAKAKKINDVSIITARVEGNMNSMRTMADIIRQKDANAVVVLAAANEGKVQLLIASSDNLISKGIKANEIILKINHILGSKGGGRPNLAQAGGGEVNKIDTALKESEKIISEMLT